MSIRRSTRAVFDLIAAVALAGAAVAAYAVMTARPGWVQSAPAPHSVPHSVAAASVAGASSMAGVKVLHEIDAKAGSAFRSGASASKRYGQTIVRKVREVQIRKTPKV